jgi:hypothetical protein
MFTVLLCRRWATAVALYSPGRTGRGVPPQPGEDVLRSQETCRTAGLPAASTATSERLPRGQSAELQMRRLEATTTDTNLVPMLKRHGWLPVETARTVKRGVLPAWYQYCGEERSSVTAPGAQLVSRAAAWTCLAGRCRCRGGVGVGWGEGEGVGPAPSLGACAGMETAVLGPPGGEAWPADELAVSIPFTIQPRALSSPMPMARTTTRRRQYVAGDTGARGRVPRGGLDPPGAG